MKLAPLVLVLACTATALGQASKPVAPKVPAQLRVTAGHTVRYTRKAELSVEVKQGKKVLRQHAVTFSLTYGLEVQAATKKRIVWTLTIEKASGTESGKGVQLGPGTWSLPKAQTPLTLQVATDLQGRLRGPENGRALLKFREATKSDAATHYLFGDDVKQAGVADGPLVIAPILPGKASSSWTTRAGQAYGYLVADATRFRESWVWTARRAPKGQVSAESDALKVEAVEPLEEGVTVTPKVTTAKAKTIIDLRTGLPLQAGWTSAFSFKVKKYGLTMAFRRVEHLDRVQARPAPPKKR